MDLARIYTECGLTDTFGVSTAVSWHKCDLLSRSVRGAQYNAVDAVRDGLLPA